MSSTENILINISKQFSIYVSFTILFAAIISNILNLAVFTQLTIFRRHQSAFYFIIGSIVDFIQSVITFTFRIFTYGFNIDPSTTSVVWCKMRPTIAQTCAIISAGAVCCAAIDQYLSTNYHGRLRQMSTIKLAHRLMFIIACLALLHSILFLLFYGIVPPIGCAPLNPPFKFYTSFVHFCLVIGLIPISIASTFAILAYFNVRRIIRQQIPVVRRRLDKQLTAMVLVRVILYVSTTLPFIGYQIYQLNVPPDPNNILRLAIDQLLAAVFYTVYFTNYSVFNS